MNKRLAVLIILLAISTMFLKGQDSLTNPINFSIKPQVGFILPHSSKIEHLSNTNPFGVEAEVSWLRIKEKNYQQCNCYSKAGFSFLYINFDNPQVVGSSYNFIGFAEPFLYRSESFFISARMGAGITFLNKIYNEKTNPENLFFSTNLAFIVDVDLNAYYKLHDNFLLLAFAKYNHISNGGIKSPNYGMNFPTFGVGINYTYKGKFGFPEAKKQKFDPGWFYETNVFGTVKKIEKDSLYSEATNLIIGFYGLAGRTISKLNGISVGFEYINDGAAKEKIERRNLNTDHQQVSFLIGHHLLLGRFDFSQHWGTYIYAPYKIKNFYQRYTLSYLIANRFKIGASLKVHGDWADSFNLLLGYSF
ncbi:MAG: acyloxyacyl hydrolase [Bacteroidales bacterium]